MPVIVLEGAVVEDVAVLVDLDERAPLWSWARRNVSIMCLRSMSWVRATKVASAPRARLTGLKGWSTEPNGVDLVTLPTSTGRRVLALGQPVDLVVEQQDREVDVAAQGVDEVVAADRQAVAVAGDDPHVEVGPGHGQAGGDGRRPAVDRVHAVGVHVVREAARAADARDEHGVLAGDAEVGHQHLHGGEDRVVAAARAPADLLVAGPVLLGGGRERRSSVIVRARLQDGRARSRRR